MTLTIANVDELATYVGKPLGTSGWHEVTQEQVNTFADATGDHQWIHVDVERAASGPFGGTIAHGYLTLSLLPMLSAEIVHVDGLAMGVNYGLNKLRFPSPVKVGSKVRGTAELLSLKERPGGFLEQTTKFTVEVEGADRPALIAETVTLLRPA